MAEENDLAAGVAEVLAKRGARRPSEVELSQIPGGASRETWLAEAGDQRLRPPP